MTPARDATVAARVPHDLRADLEKIAARDGLELSLVIRRILRAGADRELNGDVTVLAGADGLFSSTGTARRRGTPTELAAALKVAPRVGTARFNALAAFELAGHRGHTPDEVCALLEPAPVNGTARRVTDLAQAHAIEPLRLVGATAGPRATAANVQRPLARDEHVLENTDAVVRKTRAGAWAHVYVITPLGHRLLEDARAQHRAKVAQEAQTA